MQEAPEKQEQGTDVQHLLKQADAAHEDALKGLGEVATSGPAYVEDGQVVTPKDAQDDLARRQLNGGRAS